MWKQKTALRGRFFVCGAGWENLPRLSPCRHKARAGHRLAVRRTRLTALRRSILHAKRAGALLIPSCVSR